MKCSECDYAKPNNCKQQCMGSLKAGGDDREAVLRGYHDEMVSLCKLCGSLNQLRTLAETYSEGRIVTLHKFACEGDPKPECFYTDVNGPWCLGLCDGDDDQPIENCQKCWFCESGNFAYAHAEAES